jgi:hypothetical protein
LPEGIAVAVPDQNLQPVAPLAAEDEPRPRLRIALQILPDQDGERVKTLPHVRRVEAEMDRRRGGVQHGDTALLPDGYSEGDDGVDFDDDNAANK